MAAKEAFRFYSVDYFGIRGMTIVLCKESQKGEY